MKVERLQRDMQKELHEHCDTTAGNVQQCTFVTPAGGSIFLPLLRGFLRPEGGGGGGGGVPFAPEGGGGGGGGLLIPVEGGGGGGGAFLPVAAVQVLQT